MADELPNVGDLARVVRTCECAVSQQFLGRYYTVTADLGVHHNVVCHYCDRAFDPTHCVSVDSAPDSTVPRSWLRRIPPLADLESADTITEIESERPRERVSA